MRPTQKRLLHNRWLLVIAIGSLTVNVFFLTSYFRVQQDQYDLYLKSPSEGELPYLTIHCILSRLGNQMSLLATLVGVANLNGRRAAIRPCHLEKLTQHFALTSFPILTSPDKKLIGYSLGTFLHPSNDTNIPNDATILVGERYPFSYTFFQKSVPEIRRLLTFRSKYTDYAQRMIRQIAEHYKENVENCIFVGVHVRITDYPLALKKRQGRAIDAEYFRKGMDHFRRKFGRTANKTRRLIFVVASDNRDWCKKTFQEYNDVFVSPNVKDAGFDMSLLVACNHSLISYGTFSFWTALLKENGETVRFDDFYKPGSDFLKQFPYDKEYPPSWIPISTTPTDFWKKFQ